MNVLETEWWTMALPPEWWAEAEGDSILVGDRDDVGCIEISTLRRDEGEFSPDEVRTLAQENAEQGVDWQAVSLGDFAGVTASYQDEDAALREWYVAHGQQLLFITYSCDGENRGMDDAAVDQLLDTLLPVE
ncbi:MAG: hypothetical protein ACPG1A_01470 [Halioglobus sp.]